MSDYPRGSEWRRWDLHIHTKGTNKNDQFRSSTDFDAFCVTMFKKALDKKIAAIGITDYFSVENYQKVLKYVANLSSTDFDDEEKDAIRNILILPNVELRMLPVTESGRLVNIHCIFNPAFVDKLENDFFGSIEYSNGDRKCKMNHQGLIELGHSLEAGLDEAAAYKRGVDNFVVQQDRLQELLTSKEFAKNTIVVVSNSGIDGASGFSQHFDFFEHTDPGSLEATRRAIYKISNMIFSSFESDRSYFLGERADDEKTVKRKCGSLKPCIHGSDAHTEDKLFVPDEDRFCWIKADPTFDGLKQVIYEPADRVFIGLEPPVIDRVRSNKTKYIDSLTVNQKSGYTEVQGAWFKDISIDLNKELVAIIGNKGSGKSALSDIIGVLGNTHNAGYQHENLSFLNATSKNLKFRKRGYSENFEAEMVWEDGDGKNFYVPLDTNVDVDERERVRYLPQNYFENLTNDLEGKGFDKTLKSVIFLHLPEEQRLDSRTFEELEEIKSKSIEIDLTKLRDELHVISQDIVKLESKSHPSNIKYLDSQIEEKQKELREHEKNKPKKVADPSKSQGKEESQAKGKQYARLETLNTKEETINQEIITQRQALNDLTKQKEELSQLQNSLSRLETEVQDYKEENRELFLKYKLDIDQIVKADFTKTTISAKVANKSSEILLVQHTLRSRSAIETDTTLDPQQKTQALKSSLTVQLEDTQTEITTIKKDLSRPEKEFQEYKEKLAKWEKAKQAIEGSDTQINTLRFYTKEETYINKELPKELKTKRDDRLKKSLEVFTKQKEIIELYKTFKESIDKEIDKDKEFTKKFKMVIDVNFKLDPDFEDTFLGHINKTRKGTFYGTGEKEIGEIIAERDFLNEADLTYVLNTAIKWLEVDKRAGAEEDKDRAISDQVNKPVDFYDFLFSLDYLKPIYELKLDGKILNELSPGEKGTLLLVFYLMIDKEDIPLIIDQPEDNLDNKSVFQVLTHFIKSAKKRRQIIIVTHNPNLAVGADAEQIIHVELDKKSNKNKFSFNAGSIENLEINEALVEILEGTMPAFDKRKLRYREES